VDEAVALKLFVEGEHGAFAQGVSIASTAAATEEDLGSGGRNRDRSSSGGRAGASKIEGRETSVVTSAATATVVEGRLAHGRVSNLDRHCDFWIYIYKAVELVVWGLALMLLDRREGEGK